MFEVKPANTLCLSSYTEKHGDVMCAEEVEGDSRRGSRSERVNRRI